jgi:hypothetical protein
VRLLATEKANRRLSEIYNLIVEDEDARVCREISDEACRYVPFNFFAIIAANSLSKLGDELANPKTVLAWLLNFVGAPVYLVGLLVPLRESGSLLPQLAIAAFVRRLAVRKWIWAAGSVIQGGAIAGMGIVAWTLEGEVAGFLIVGLLLLFSLARGLCSVSYKDVLGKTIPKTRRGRLNGLSGTVSGALALFVGLFFLMRDPGSADPAFFGALIVAAGLLWVAGAAVFAGVQEFEGETDGGGNALFEAVQRLKLLRDDPPFARFVTVRALMLGSALSAPYYVVMATGAENAQAATLGLFIIANGLASTLSAPFWGRLADASSKRVMVAAALMAAGLGIGVFLLAQLMPLLAQSALLFAVLYFFLGIAHSGARLGRKTYVVDLAGGNRRTDYVAVSNTLIGVILLFSGAIGALAGALSPAAAILMFSLLGLAGAILGMGLPEAR